jgi:hypothetical protein
VATAGSARFARGANDTGIPSAVMIAGAATTGGSTGASGMVEPGGSAPGGRPALDAPDADPLGARPHPIRVRRSPAKIRKIAACRLFTTLSRPR